MTHLPGARDCLMDLSELDCNSNVHSEFFYQLSKTCHNIQSLNIRFRNTVSDGLKHLISSQNNLKKLSLTQPFGEIRLDWNEILTPLTNHSNTITKLILKNYRPLSLIANFTNLEELVLSSYADTALEEGFKELQYVSFPRLRTLGFYYGRPKAEMITKFLEINGRNLKELYLYKCDNSLNLIVTKYCPNLKFF